MIPPQTFLRTNDLLTSNMYGDILSNLANALAGSVGLASVLNIGERHAAANVGHGSAPDIAGQGIANLVSLVLSAAMLLRWYGERSGASKFREAAADIDEAVDTTLRTPNTRSRDVGWYGNKRGGRRWYSQTGRQAKEPLAHSPTARRCITGPA
jgi:3-isopropylmalate dehydrogenase